MNKDGNTTSVCDLLYFEQIRSTVTFGRSSLKFRVINILTMIIEYREVSSSPDQVVQTKDDNIIIVDLS